MPISALVLSVARSLGGPLRVESFVGSVREVAELHIQAFPGFFLTELGKSFLAGYYRCVNAYPGGILLLVRRDDGVAVGFAAGFLDPPAFYRFLRSKFGRFILPLIGAILRRPTLLRRVYLDFKYVAGRAGGSSSSDSAACELASIGVVEPGAGVGSLLIDQFLLRSRELGSRSVILVTERDHNAVVNRFYTQKGFTLMREFAQTPGRFMNEYQLELVGPD